MDRRVKPGDEIRWGVRIASRIRITSAQNVADTPPSTSMIWPVT
jgi:hypothetical protein